MASTALAFLSVVAILGMIVLAFIASIIFLLVFKYHLVLSVKLSFDHNTAASSLLAFLQSRAEVEDKQLEVYKLLAEKDLPSFEEFYRIAKEQIEKQLFDQLSLSTLSDFSFLAGNEEYLSKGELQDFASAKGFVALPYNPTKLVQKVELRVEA